MYDKAIAIVLVMIAAFILMASIGNSAQAYSNYDYVGNNLKRGTGVVNFGIMGGIDMYQTLGYHQPVVGFYAIAPLYGNITGGIWGLNSGTVGLSLGVNIK